jgi:hypothetical protein
MTSGPLIRKLAPGYGSGLIRKRELAFIAYRRILRAKGRRGDGWEARIRTLIA